MMLLFCLHADAIDDRYAADGAPNDWRRPLALRAQLVSAMETKKDVFKKSSFSITLKASHTFPYALFGTLQHVSVEERFAKEKGTMLMREHQHCP